MFHCCCFAAAASADAIIKLLNSIADVPAVAADRSTIVVVAAVAVFVAADPEL